MGCCYFNKESIMGERRHEDRHPGDFDRQERITKQQI